MQRHDRTHHGQLAHSSESVIHVGIIVLKLDQWFAELLVRLLQSLQLRLDAVIRLSEQDEVDSSLLQAPDLIALWCELDAEMTAKLEKP